jgi:hypothetical protein
MDTARAAARIMDTIRRKKKMTDDRIQRTHWETCYLEKGHHECALRKIEELEADLSFTKKKLGEKDKEIKMLMGELNRKS